MDVPALHLVIDDEADVRDNSSTMMEAVETYLRLKPDKQTPTFIGWSKTFFQGAERAIGYLEEATYAEELSSLSALDAARFRDYLLGKSMTASSCC